MKCAHCQIDYPKHSLIFKNDRAFCCTGCASVYEIIHLNGLDEFYKKANNLSKVQICSNYTPTPEILEDGSAKINFIIANAHCAACVWLCEKMLLKNPGVLQIDINPASYAAKVIYNPALCSEKDIVLILTNIGYGCLAPFSQNNETVFIKQYYARLIVAIACLCNIMWLSIAKYAGSFGQISPKATDILNFAEFVLTCPVIFYCANGLFISAINGLKARILNMDFLIVLASLLAFIYSVFSMLHHQNDTYFDSITMLLCFIYFARFAQAKITNAALRQVRLLSNWLAGDVRVLDQNENESMQSATSVSVGSLILVKKGERVLIDGEFIKGNALIDASFLTGESDLIKPAKFISSGCVCASGSFIYKSSATLSASRLARIDETLTHTHKSRTQDICASFGHFFSILVIAACALCGWLYHDVARCIAVLIIACPCALSLSAPLAGLLASSKALRMGILLKTSDFLPLIIKNVVFDKTGTLSTLQISNDLNEFAYKDELYTLAKLNTHPIAQAILQKLGSANLLEGEFSEATALGASLKTAKADFYLGKEGSQTVFKKDNKIVCVFNVQNTAKSDAISCVKELKNDNYKLSIISGDNEQNTSKLAKELAISDFAFGISPERKIDYVDKFSLFVGDGHNDALALKKAAFSLSLSDASELARVHADGILLHNDLNAVYKLLRLIKKTRKVIFSNFAISLVYNLAFIPLAFAGLINPLIAAALMSASSICIVLNSLRIK